MIEGEVPMELLSNLALNSINPLLIYRASDKKTILISKGMADLFGYSLSDFNNSGIEIIMPPEHREKHAKYIYSYLLGDKEAKKVIGKNRLELKAVNKKGENIDIDIGVDRFDLMGETYFTTLLHDVTHYKILERELKKALTDKDLFLGMIAHEIKGPPLNSIIGFTGLILAGNHTLSTEIVEYLKIIESQGHKISEIVSSLTNLSRLSTGNYVSQIVEFDLGDFFNKEYLSFKDTKYREKFAPGISSINANITLEDDFNPQIHADKSAYKRIFSNLIMNAIKYNVDKGEVNINVHRYDENNLEVRLQNTTSEGIPEDRYGSIFNPYERAEKKESIIKGTGLGLYIAKLFTEALGGSISVSSELGKSVEFKLILPYEPLTSESSRGYHMRGTF